MYYTINKNDKKLFNCIWQSKKFVPLKYIISLFNYLNSNKLLFYLIWMSSVSLLYLSKILGHNIFLVLKQFKYSLSNISLQLTLRVHVNLLVQTITCNQRCQQCINRGSFVTHFFRWNSGTSCFSVTIVQRRWETVLNFWQAGLRSD